MQKGLRRVSIVGRSLLGAMGVAILVIGWNMAESPWIVASAIFIAGASLGFAFFSRTGGATEEEISQEPVVESICGTCLRIDVPMGESSISVPVLGGMPLHVPKHWEEDFQSGQVYDLECVVMPIGSYLNAFDTVAVVLSIEGLRSLDAEIEAGIMEIHPNLPGWLGIFALVTSMGLLGLIGADSGGQVAAVLACSLGLSFALAGSAIWIHRKNVVVVERANEASQDRVRTCSRGGF